MSKKSIKMNPITNMKNLNKMNEREIEMGVAGTGKSWHNQVPLHLSHKTFQIELTQFSLFIVQRLCLGFRWWTSL